MSPVVGNSGKVEGVVADRDICIAMGTRNRLAGDLTVAEIAIKSVITCKPEDEIHETLHTMAEKHVRRLPVVDNVGVPQGILSMDDISTHGDLNKWQGCCELSAEEIIRALKRLYGRKFPVLRAKSAVARRYDTLSFLPWSQSYLTAHRKYGARRMCDDLVGGGSFDASDQSCQRVHSAHA